MGSVLGCFDLRLGQQLGIDKALHPFVGSSARLDKDVLLFVCAGNAAASNQKEELLVIYRFCAFKDGC